MLTCGKECFLQSLRTSEGHVVFNESNTTKAYKLEECCNCFEYLELVHLYAYQYLCIAPNIKF